MLSTVTNSQLKDINKMSAGKITTKTSFTFLPLTPAKWNDFEILFGERGACGGCWCMSWRLKSAEFEKNKGTGNKELMRKIVKSGEVPGILAYSENEPVGWCAIAPREVYTRLENSRVLKPIDEKSVWSVSCLFIKKNYRRKGLSIQLLKAAVEYCRSQGGHIVEAYPVIPYSEKMPDAFAWTGILSSYQKAGFREAARRSEARPIMRYYLEK